MINNQTDVLRIITIIVSLFACNTIGNDLPLIFIGISEHRLYFKTIDSDGEETIERSNAISCMSVDILISSYEGLTSM